MSMEGACFYGDLLSAILCSASSTWRGNRRMTRLRRHPATYRPMALTLTGPAFL
ncbi:hypothetical protein CBX59_007400 [Salmonella enterica]|nr:hypothetical protein [Salmonella enterica]